MARSSRWTRVRIAGRMARKNASGRIPGTAAISLAACACVVALAGCGSALLGSHDSAAPGLGATSSAPRSYTVASPVTTVVINGGAGSITVTGSSLPAVAVTERAYYSNAAKPPSASHVVRGGTLTLSYSCPTQLSCGVAYDVRVPRGVAVQVSDREGVITLASLAGPVTARTVAGVITAAGLASPSVSLKSNAGAITAAFTAVPASVSASTNAGSITLTLPPSAAYNVHAHTYVGSTSVTVRRSATAKSAISASSDLGSISISPLSWLAHA